MKLSEASLRAPGSMDHLAESLALALTRDIGMAAEDADEVARFVANAFAGKPELDDSELPPDLRSIFYTLEGHRLVSFRREEFHLETGELRRAFFWHLRWENIRAKGQQPAADVQPTSVYEALPRTAWKRAAS